MNPQPMFDKYQNVAQTFLVQAANQPTKVAVYFSDKTYTYQELADRSIQLANLFRSQGVKAGQRIAYFLPNGIDLITIFYAVQIVGAIAVPINARSSAREVEYFVQSVAASMLIFDQARENKVSPCVNQFQQTTKFFSTDTDLSWAPNIFSLAKKESTSLHDIFLEASAPSRIQFTGGSTGVPKGAVRSHLADLVNIVGTYQSNGLDHDETKIVLIQCPMEHHGGHAWFTSALALGSSLVVIGVFNAETILAAIQRYQVSYMILLPPSTYSRLMADKNIADYDLTSVKLVQTSAGSTTRQIIQDMYRHFPNSRVNYGWGQTESGLGSSMVLTREMARTNAKQLTSIGKPMPFVEMKLVDSKEQEVPIGQTGECMIRTKAIMDGYWNQPELSAQVLRKDGWLLTGDLMVKDEDGLYYLTSRKREVIKSGGENVFIGEVENVIKSYPGVLDCMVYSVPDSKLVEAVGAVVELEPGVRITLNQLQNHCQKYLASFKKPRSLKILPSLGRDYSGKINREWVLRQIIAQDARQASEDAYPDLLDVTQRLVHPLQIYRINIPFRRSGLETACYLIKSGNHGLLVDPGFYSPIGLGNILRSLAYVGLSPETTDVFVTHEHPDHSSMIPYVSNRHNTVYVTKELLSQAQRAETNSYRKAIYDRLQAEGFSSEDCETFTGFETGSNPTTNQLRYCVGVEDHQMINCGEISFEVVSTPGHTLGHACLYQGETKTLFLGDHLLFHMSPGVFFCPSTPEIFDKYFSSLVKIGGLDVDWALPAHLGPRHHEVVGGELKRRILDLKIHHQNRLLLITSLVDMFEELSACDIVRLIPWNLPSQSWDAVDKSMQWVTASETIAYLDQLVSSGEILQHNSHNRFTYSCSHKEENNGFHIN